MTDSLRWCETCQAYGDHHTDRHPLTMDEVVAMMEQIIKVVGTPLEPKRRWWKWWL